MIVIICILRGVALYCTCISLICINVRFCSAFIYGPPLCIKTGNCRNCRIGSQIQVIISKQNRIRRSTVLNLIIFCDTSIQLSGQNIELFLPHFCSTIVNHIIERSRFSIYDMGHKNSQFCNMAIFQ